MRRLALFLLLVVGIAACTPLRSRLAPPYPYQGEMVSEERIREIAAEVCGFSPSHPRPPELHEFTTDGCSAWPDRHYLECCVAHDIRYWCASSGLTRKEADKEFRDCVRERSTASNASLMYWSVRIAGSRALPFSWRWGYGYEWLAIPNELAGAADDSEAETSECHDDSTASK